MDAGKVENIVKKGTKRKGKERTRNRRQGVGLKQGGNARRKGNSEAGKVEKERKRKGKNQKTEHRKKQNWNGRAKTR